MYFIENCPICDGNKLDVYQSLVMPFVSDRTGIWKPFLIEKKYFKELKEGLSYLSTYTCECTKCGHLFAKHRFTDAEMTKLYDKYRGEEYNNLRKRYEINYSLKDEYFKKKINNIDRINNNILRLNNHSEINLLDWGGGDGINTPGINFSSNVTIFDISSEIRFKKLKGNILKKYNTITALHVLEHVNYPKDTISEMIKYADKNTLFYIEVPYEKEVEEISEIKKLHWHEHINCFTINSLEHLLINVNINPITIEIKDLSDDFRNFKVISCYAKYQ